MPGDENRRQKALARKAARRKEKKSEQARSSPPAAPTSPRAMLRSAAYWPVFECLVTRDWNRTDREPQLVQVVVARQSPHGPIAAATVLMDLACLGAKNAYARAFDDRADYQELVAHLGQEQPFDRVDLDLAAKIVRDGIAYARSLGFQPHRDYGLAAPFFQGAEPDRCPVAIPLGYHGRPFFIAGPYDRVDVIVTRLTRAVGPGNFDVLAPLSPEIAARLGLGRPAE
jgi:hypothetical protein